MVQLTNGFKVSISSGSDYATFTTTQTLQKHNEELAVLEGSGSGLTVTLDEEYITKDEFDWGNSAKKGFGLLGNSVAFSDQSAAFYREVPNAFKRQYAYKIHKITKAIGKPAKVR